METWTITIFSRTKRVEKLRDMIQFWEQSYVSFNSEHELVLEGRVMTSTAGDKNVQFEFSDRFFAILHQIPSLPSGASGQGKMFELHLQEPGCSKEYGYSARKKQEKTFLVTMGGIVEIYSMDGGWRGKTTHSNRNTSYS